MTSWVMAKSAPAPPRGSGMSMPSSPASPIRFQSSRGTSPASSQAS